MWLIGLTLRHKKLEENKFTQIENQNLYYFMQIKKMVSYGW